jgi:serine/threonine protein kinase
MARPIPSVCTDDTALIFKPGQQISIGMHNYILDKTVYCSYYTIVCVGHFSGPGDGSEKLALKFIKQCDEKPEANILQEISLYRVISHDSIVPLRDDFPFGSFHCAVFPYATGGSLNDYQDSRAISESDAKSIIAQLLSALATLHDFGFVHCDVKQENILVRHVSPLLIWLCDFGFSRPIADAKKFHDIVGTRSYAAPEMFQRNGCTFIFLIHSYRKSGYMVCWHCFICFAVWQISNRKASRLLEEC